MPCYNAAEYVIDACYSILNQTFQMWSLIAIDDGSCDATYQLLKTIADTRITIIRNHSNRGIVNSLNTGIDLCTTKYIARMDSDDISHPERLEKQFKFMELNDHIDICGGQINRISSNTVTKSNYPTSSSDIREALLYSNPIAHPTVMARTAVLKDAGGYRETKCFGASIEDYDLWLRLSLKGTEFANLNDILLDYMIRPNSITMTSLKQGKLFDASRTCLIANLTGVSTSNIRASESLDNYIIESKIFSLLSQKESYLSFRLTLRLLKIARFLRGRGNYLSIIRCYCSLLYLFLKKQFND